MLVEIRIRRATIDDIRALVVLSRETIDAGYRPVFGDRTVDELISNEAIESYLEEHLDDCWLIQTNQRIAGYAVSKSNLIDLMMIDRDLHGCGLGSRLLRHVEELLFRTFDELVLESFESNELANSFYTRNGWSKASASRDASTGVDRIVFRKTSRQAA